MSSSSGGSRLGSGIEWIETSKNLGSFAATVTTAAGGMVAFIFGAAIAIGDAGVGLVVTILDAFGVGGVAMVEAFLTDPAGFISRSWVQAGDSLANSAFASLGPFVPWIAAIVVLGFLYGVTEYLDRRDSDVPGLGMDLPFVGNDEEGEGLDLPFIGNDPEDEG